MRSGCSLRPCEPRGLGIELAREGNPRTTILVCVLLDGRGPARRLLLQILEARHSLILSSEILAEAARVLRYPRLQNRHGMSEGRIYDYVMSSSQLPQWFNLIHCLSRQFAMSTTLW